jgi:cadmium resistance protein CadD (predicted permease)
VLPIARVGGNVLAVAAVTMADGGDNVGAYTPLFATETAGERLVTVVIFAILTLVWCAVAAWLVRHSAFGGTIRHHGQRALPFVLIGLGTLILYRAGSFDLLRQFIQRS